MYSLCYLCCVTCLCSIKVTVLVSALSSVDMSLSVQECWKGYESVTHVCICICTLILYVIMY